VERHNGTSRLRNQRKVRKTLAFSKATRYHRWMSWLAVGLYNFCHAHSSLKIKHERHVSHQSPAMAAQLTDHIWSTREWLLCPAWRGEIITGDYQKMGEPWVYAPDLRGHDRYANSSRQVQPNYP
jgi:hypothetical protein